MPNEIVCPFQVDWMFPAAGRSGTGPGRPCQIPVDMPSIVYMESPVHFAGFSWRVPVKVLVGQEDCKPGSGNSLQLQVLKPLYVLKEVVPTEVMGTLTKQIIAFTFVS